MAENKTKPTDASVEDCIAAQGSEQPRADCRERSNGQQGFAENAS
jgi:hypothetical protein